MMSLSNSYVDLLISVNLSCDKVIIAYITYTLQSMSGHQLVYIQTVCCNMTFSDLPCDDREFFLFPLQPSSYLHVIHLTLE